MPERPLRLLHVTDFLQAKPPQLARNGYGQPAVLFHPDNLSAYPPPTNLKAVGFLVAIQGRQVGLPQLSHLSGPQLEVAPLQAFK